MLLLPEFLDAEIWHDFVSHREDIKKPMSSRAEKMMLNKLARADAQGWDVNEALERSIINGWQDVFPDKRKGQINGDRKPTAAERVIAANVIRFGTPRG